jgi:hypothetical protein
MPEDWFGSDVNELVSGIVLKAVAEFWEKNNPHPIPLPLSEEGV